MTTSIVRPLTAALLAALLAIAWAAPAREPDPADAVRARAEEELTRLKTRLREGGELSRLRQDLLALRLAFPGTPAAVEAGALLSGLPSPLDALSPNAIAPLERFDWQPKELVAVLGEHRGRHGAPVTCVAFNPDGSQVASGGSLLVRAWDPATLRLQGIAGAYYVTCIAYSRDGKRLASGGAYGDLRVFEVVKGGPPKLLLDTKAGTSSIYSVAFTTDSKYVACACFDNTVRCYAATGKSLQERSIVQGHTKAVTALAVAPDGKTLATGSTDESIRLWSITDGELKERAVLETGQAVTALAFSHASSILAAAGADGAVRLWTMPAASRAREKLAIPIGAGTIAALSFSATGNTLAAACSDGTVRLWRVTGTPRELHKLEGHAAAVTGVAYAPDNRTLISGGADWTVRSWDLSGAKPKERFTPWSHLSHVYGVDFSPDGQSLVSGSEDRIVRVWDLTRAEPRTRNFLKGDPIPIYCVAYSPDGKLVAAGGNSTKVRQWDAQTGRDKAYLTPTPGAVYGLMYSPDGRLLYTRMQKDLAVWDAYKGQDLRHFGIGDIFINCAALSPDGKRLLTGHGYYLMREGKIVYKKDGTPEYTDCFLRLYETEEARELAVDKSHKVPIYTAAFLGDGRLAMSGAYEAALRRWEVQPNALAPLTPWKAGTGYPQTIVPTPDGHAVLTRGLDGSLVVWDLATGKHRFAWTLPETVGGIAISSDGRHVALGLATGVIYVLRLGPAGK
jgi:WD40 repeat protein